MSSDLVLPCGSLRVVFWQKGDRIGHRIEIVDIDELVPVLESQEGRGSDIWPCSPVLQTIHVEQRPEGPVALLVGMAGASHWSASVAADQAQGQATFDIACRVSGQPSWLGSTYRWLTQCERQSRRLVKIEPMSAVSANTDGPSVVIQPAPDKKSSPRTIRWSYIIQNAQAE